MGLREAGRGIAAENSVTTTDYVRYIDGQDGSRGDAKRRGVVSCLSRDANLILTSPEPDANHGELTFLIGYTSPYEEVGLFNS